MRDPQGADLPAVEAGSHIKIPVRLLDGSLPSRSYSICSNSARRDIYEIAVLREEDGSGGSVAVHETFNIGMRLNADRPANYFSLHGDTRPSVLIAGGIGITPIKTMAQALSTSGRAFELHYAGRSRGEMAFRERLQTELGDALQVYSAEDGDRLKLEEILTAADDSAQFYVCGPERLIGAVIDTARALNIDKSRVHFERFE